MINSNTACIALLFDILYIRDISSRTFIDKILFTILSSRHSIQSFKLLFIEQHYTSIMQAWKFQLFRCNMIFCNHNLGFYSCNESHNVFVISLGHILILGSNQKIYILNLLHFNGSKISYMDLILTITNNSTVRSNSRIFLLLLWHAYVNESWTMCI